MPRDCLSSASALRRPAPRACLSGVPPVPTLSVDSPPAGVLPTDLRASASAAGLHSASLLSRLGRRSSLLPPSPRRGPEGEGPGALPDGFTVRPSFSVAILSVVLGSKVLVLDFPEQPPAGSRRIAYRQIRLVRVINLLVLLLGLMNPSRQSPSQLQQQHEE